MVYIAPLPRRRSEGAKQDCKNDVLDQHARVFGATQPCNRRLAAARRPAGPNQATSTAPKGRRAATNNKTVSLSTKRSGVTDIAQAVLLTELARQADWNTAVLRHMKAKSTTGIAEGRAAQTAAAVAAAAAPRRAAISPRERSHDISGYRSLGQESAQVSARTQGGL